MNRNCEEKPEKPQEPKPLKKEFLEFAVSETFNLASLDDDLKIGALCGVQGSKEGCLSLDVASKLEGANVTPFWTCEDLKENNESSMYECETQLISQIEEAVSSKGQFNIILVDIAVSYQMLQVMNSILSVDTHLDEWLKVNNVIITFGPESETWRRHFLDRYRIQHGDDPVARAEFILDTLESETVEIGVVTCGDIAYVYNLFTVEFHLKKTLTEKYKVDVDLRTVNAGLFPFDYDFNPPKFLQSDYDNVPGQTQFEEQEPLGRQNIFQLGPATGDKNGPISVGNLSSLAGSEINIDNLFHWFKQALITSGYDPSTGIFEKSPSVGDGVLILFSNKVCSTILVWDGRDHIDINFFTFKEGRNPTNPSRGVPDMFLAGFLKQSKFTLKINLRDDQPRGIGRVVNFPSDLKLQAPIEEDSNSIEEGSSED
jgi:hypothetical protein